MRNPRTVWAPWATVKLSSPRPSIIRPPWVPRETFGRGHFRPLGKMRIARYFATQPGRVRIDVTLVTDATAAFDSDRMKAAATNAPMFARATEGLMSRLPTVNGYKRPSPRLSTYSLISHGMLFAYDLPLCASSGPSAWAPPT